MRYSELVETQTDSQRQLVTFQLGQEIYGIDIMDVREIVQMDEVRPIPNAPPSVEGIFNLRGEIIPVINLHKRFHIRKIEFEDDEELLTGTIIISINNTKLGMMVDKILRVLPIDVQSIQPPPQILTGIGAEYIQGVISSEEGYLIILDIRRLFDPRELQQFGAMGR
jgi:purine-binding chemotaxis protein CheW